MKKKIGIIGCGAVTELLYLKTLPLFNNIEIKYLADKDLTRAEKLAQKFQAKSTLDLKELRENCDVIIVCTPPDSHFNLVKDSLLKGKMVICEKPFLPEATQVTELVKIAKGADAILLVAHFRRLFPCVQLAKGLIETSGLGNLISLNISEGGRFNWGAVSNYFMVNPLGGVALDTGSHTIDMALYASGLDTSDFTIKSTKVKKDKSEPSHEVEAELVIEFNNQPVTININLSRYKILANQIVFTFERGKITIPVGPVNFAKIERESKKTVIYSDTKLPNVNAAFYEQYRKIFVMEEPGMFKADRFYNLVNILESINKA